ncbi:MAG: WYL domain-containing protein [Acidimicrobiia bacterium]|nr:WYL domain-containing protein [Acidimicrobiia bacterium]
MTRRSASSSVARMLSLVPWVASHDEGVPLAEVAERFGITERQLLGDLDVLSFVGVPPFTPDTLLDVRIEADRVWIRPQWFDRPLRLTAEQGLALVAAGESLLAVQGADADGPLARALAKLSVVVGVAPGRQLDVDLGAADREILEALTTAAGTQRAVRIDHYSANRHQRVERVIEPWAVHNRAGAWYVEAWCQLADDVRQFRLDRIASVVDVGEAPTRDVEAGSSERYNPQPEDPQVTLALAPTGRWVLERVDHRVVVDHPAAADDEVVAQFTVSGRAWLERLLLQLGPAARVLDVTGDAALANVGSDAARRILSRYQSAPLP